MDNTQTSKIKLDNDKDSSEINDNNISSQKEKYKSSKTKNESPKKGESKKSGKKKEEEDDFVLPVKSIKRSNSIKLYKKHKKDKEKRISTKEISKEIKDKNGNIFNVEIDVGTNRENKGSKNGKQKKVVFLPNFLTIIDVESYKKFNEENTCKDPFDNMEIINGHINIKNNDDEEEGKVKVLCSCIIC